MFNLFLFIRNTIRKSFFWLFLQVISLSVVAQQIGFEHLGTARGLSQSNVTCILQDSRGFMWFGTRDGLNKYDGYGFVIYKNSAGDPHSLGNNFITSLIEDKEGNLWIGTWGGGLDRWEREKDRFTHYSHAKNAGSLSNDFINSLMQDEQGNIWIGTDGGGLNILDPVTGRSTNYIHDDKDAKSLGDNDVTHIFKDSRHRVWIGTSHGGLNLFDRNRHVFTRFLHDDKDSLSLSCNTVWRIFEDSRFRLWIGTKGGGLDLFDPSRARFHHHKNNPTDGNSLATNIVVALCGDEDGKIWVGTENGGISVLDPDKGIFHSYRHDDIDNTSLGNNSIYSLYKDSRGNMWVGTYSSGVELFNKSANKFHHFKHNSSPGSLSNNNVLNLVEDSRNNLWVGTDGGGLELFDRQTGRFIHYRHKAADKNSICGDYVLSVREDSEGSLWVGTWGDGLTVISRKRDQFRHYKSSPSDTAALSGNNIYALTEDKDKEVWVGTYGNGLNLYDRKKDRFLRYRHDDNNPNSISSDRILTLAGDDKGYLWIGTFDGGLDRLDKKTNTFIHYRHDDNKNSLSNNTVNYVYVDSRGNLWICTADGLNRLDSQTGHFTVYSTKDGLPNAMIFGILEDKQGNLWVSTNNGLSRFDPAKRVFTGFSVADGLQSNEFKPHSCFKSVSGMLYFGGINGFNSFFPDSIKEAAYEPPLMITGFQVFNKDVLISSGDTLVTPLKKSITETKEITLSYKNAVISFEFASLNYTIPEKKQYAYRLEGFDKKWNNIGTRRLATYTNLDPGDYIFKVRGLNNNGRWSADTTDIRLIITPPFWQTWWFRLLAAVSIAGSVISFHKVRMSVIQAQKKKLEQQVAVLLDKAVAQGKYEIASDVMHDIGNAVVGFGSYLTRIRRLLEESNRDDLQRLAGFFETNQPAMAAAIGESKAVAVVTMLNGIGKTQKDNQEEIRNSISEQLNIITRIQEILNIQRQYITGQETQERKPVNLRSVINDSMSMLFSSVDKAAIAVSLDLPEDLPPIKGDRTRLMQLILNILKNSIEAIDINAAVKTISLRVQRQEAMLVLLVRDSGSGFNETTAGRLFERGFTTKSTGSGLGLYNCRTIVESHEGSVDITSDGHGKGALTTIRFKI